MSTRASGSSAHHESAAAQVAGTATYIDDMAEARGTLHAAGIGDRAHTNRLY